MHYRITHSTSFEYDENVSLSYNEARLMPRNCANQQVISSTLNIEPYADDFRTRLDFFGNQVAYFSVQQAHQVFTVTAVSEVLLLGNPAQLDFYHKISWENVRDLLSGKHLLSGQDLSVLNLYDDIIDACQYTLNSPLIETTPQLAEYALPSFTVGRSITYGFVTQLT